MNSNLPEKLGGMSPTSGTFNNYLSKLRTLELIEGGLGALQASRELY